MVYTNCPLTKEDSKKIFNYIAKTLYQDKIDKANALWKDFLQAYKKEADEFFKDCPPAVIQYCSEFKISNYSHVFVVLLDENIPALPDLHYDIFSPQIVVDINGISYSWAFVNVLYDFFDAIQNIPESIIYTSLAFNLKNERNFSIRSEYDKTKKAYSVSITNFSLNIEYDVPGIDTFIKELEAEKINKLEKILSCFVPEIEEIPVEEKDTSEIKSEESDVEITQPAVNLEEAEEKLQDGDWDNERFNDALLTNEIEIPCEEEAIFVQETASFIESLSLNDFEMALPDSENKIEISVVEEKSEQIQESVASIQENAETKTKKKTKVEDLSLQPTLFDFDA